LRSLFPTLDWENRGYFVLGYGRSITFRDAKAYDLFSNSDRGRREQLDLTVPLSTLPHSFRLLTALSWSKEQVGSNGVLGGSYSSRFVHHEMHLQAGVAYEALRWMVPDLRLGVGLHLTQMRLWRPGADQEFTDSWNPAVGGTANLGVTFRSPAFARSGAGHFPAGWLGVRFEAAYSLARAQEFILNPQDGGDFSIPTSGTSLGEVPISAASLGVSILLGL